MLKLSALVHTQRKIISGDAERFFSRHPFWGMIFCGIIMPTLVLAAVGVMCCAVMLPIAFFMGWL